jgi:hypothetical protein
MAAGEISRGVQLSDATYSSPRRYVRGSVAISVIAVALTAGCASSTTAGTESITSRTPTVARPPSVSVPVTSSSRSTSEAESPTAEGSADDGGFTMPDEVGSVLQDAQDDIQRASGDPVFFSHSHDLLGSRLQVLDGNWKVCSQNVAAGTKASAIEHIDFGVVKTDESCP